jgi:hypothetical protein
MENLELVSCCTDIHGNCICTYFDYGEPTESCLGQVWWTVFVPILLSGLFTLLTYWVTDFLDPYLFSPQPSTPEDYFDGLQRLFRTEEEAAEAEEARREQMSAMDQMLKYESCPSMHSVCAQIRSRISLLDLSAGHRALEEVRRQYRTRCLEPLVAQRVTWLLELQGGIPPTPKRISSHSFVVDVTERALTAGDEEVVPAEPAQKRHEVTPEPESDSDIGDFCKLFS